MNRIIDFEKFKEKCATFDKPLLKDMLLDWAFERILHELVLVNAINSCKENGNVIPKKETLADLENIVQGERIIINLLGRREAAKVYGMMEDITSDVKTVDYVLTSDLIGHYKNIVKSE